MKTKNSNPVQFLEGRSVGIILTLYFQINHLKQLYRQGWLRKGRDISESYCESDADHCFAMSILSLFVCDLYFPTLDRLKVVTMCLIHELGEIANGDPQSTRDPQLKNEKYWKERSAIFSLLEDFPNQNEYLKLWEEFEEGNTPESKLVKQLDKLEMALQSKIYALQHGKNLQEFLDDVRLDLESPELIDILNDIEKL